MFEQLDTPRTTIFGKPFTKMKTGKPDTTPQKIVTGDNAIIYLESVPIVYFPKFKADADRPLGPLDGIGVNYSTIFGFQLMTTWNVFESDRHHSRCGQEMAVVRRLHDRAAAGRGHLLP